jgi:hypothetical protein
MVKLKSIHAALGTNKLNSRQLIDVIRIVNGSETVKHHGILLLNFSILLSPQ